MLSPSTAPRWKTATRTLPFAAAAAAVRTRNRGGPASATSAHAPHLRNARRSMLVISSGSSPLELGRADDEGGEPGHVRVRRSAVVGREAGDPWIRKLLGQDG